MLSSFGGERNMVRILFTHPQAKTVFAEWPSVVRNTVHALRLNAGYFPEDREVATLANEIMDMSPEFRELWGEQAVGSLTRTFKVFVHPEVGRVELTYQTFDVHDAPGLQLLVGTAQPGSRSEEAVAYLASMAAPAAPPARSGLRAGSACHRPRPARRDAQISLFHRRSIVARPESSRVTTMRFKKLPSSA